MNYQILGQINPSANTLSNVYVSNSEAVCSSLVVCNLNNTSCEYSLAVQENGAALSNEHYLAFNTSLLANETHYLTVGLTLANTDIVSANTTGNVSFSLFGSTL